MEYNTILSEASTPSVRDRALGMPTPSFTGLRHSSFWALDLSTDVPSQDGRGGCAAVANHDVITINDAITINDVITINDAITINEAAKAAYLTSVAAIDIASNKAMNAGGTAPVNATQGSPPREGPR